MAIDKSIRQYQQLVQPGTGRPGYAGTEMYFRGKKIKKNIKDLDAEIKSIKSFIDQGENVEQHHIQYREDLKVAKHNKLLKEDPERPGTKVKQSWEWKNPPVYKKTSTDLTEKDPFKKGMETVLESPIKKAGLGKTELVSTQRPDWKKAIVDTLVGNYLGKRIPGGVKTIKGIKNLFTGEKSFRDIPSNYLASYQGKSPFQSALQAGRALDLGKKILSGTGKGILSAAPLLGAGAGIAYLHKNRERFTGYDTQREYEEARQGRIDADRVQMRLDPQTKENLEINWKRQGFSDDEIKEKGREYDKKTADLAGLGITEKGDILTGSDMGWDIATGGDPITPQFPGEDEMIQQQREKAEFDRAVAENKAKAEAEAAAQRAYAARVPDPIYQPQGGGGGGRSGQTSQAAADRAGGSSYSSPFKYGGPVYVYKRNNSIDKALKGRKRDI